MSQCNDVSKRKIYTIKFSCDNYAEYFFMRVGNFVNQFVCKNVSRIQLMLSETHNIIVNSYTV